MGQTHYKTANSKFSYGQVHREYSIATCTLLWYKEIANLLPHPVCSRGTARLEKRQIDRVRACAENFQKAESISYPSDQKYITFYSTRHGTNIQFIFNLFCFNLNTL